MVRRVELNGATHTDESLASMKTGEIAALVGAISGSAAPKPATKARAIDLFFKAAATLPQEPAAAPETKRRPNAKTIPMDAAAETQDAEKQASAKARKVKTYSVRIEGAEAAAKVAAMHPLGRGIIEAMSAAKKPLSMAELSAIVVGMSKTKRPEKLIAWHFCRLFRPAGILVEERAQ